MYVSFSASVAIISVLLTVGRRFFELRHRQTPIEEDQGSAVFEFSVGGPLHADELWRQDGEARVAELDDRFGIGDGIVEALGLGGVNDRRSDSGRSCDARSLAPLLPGSSQPRTRSRPENDAI